MQIIQLWDAVPGYEEGHHLPTLEYYPTEVKRGGGAVVIFPGGGYSHRAVHEGQGYAEFLNKNGLDAFVLQYRVAPTRHPYPLLDARRAVRYVRANAEKYGIDPEKIAVMGSSAGGHLAALLSTYRGEIDGEGYDEMDNVSYLPSAQILCYPVTSIMSHRGSYNNLLGERVSELSESLNPIAICPPDAPPAFIWHTETDTCVNISGTYSYVDKLHSLGISTEFHVYSSGRHGMGLAENHPSAKRWSGELIFWLGLMGFID